MVEHLGQVLPEGARRFGEKTALICGDRRFSFSELNDLSGRLANGLRGLGVAPGDRVALYAPNGWEWVVSYFAILRAGAVVNPINALLTTEEVRYIVRDCGAAAILAPQSKGRALLEIKGDASLREVILFGDAVPDGAQALDDLLARHRPEHADAEIAADSLSTVGYTSGTTGYPKGAMLSHRAVVLNAAMTANMHVRTAADTVVFAVPCAHVYGNVIMNGALQCGMTLVLLERFSEEGVLEAIERHRATMFEGVPTMYMYLLNYPRLDTYDLRWYRLSRPRIGV